MARVVLIGDSIRLSYEKTVQSELEGVAEVWGPPENGGNTVNVLMHWHIWVLKQKPDLVHLNAGLHDLKTLYYGGRDNLVPLAHYRSNVETLLRITRSIAGVKVIWATTTPVRDESAHRAHAQWQDFDRYNDDVRSYNQAAVEVCRQLDVPVNDLYSAVDAALDAFPICNDGVHFEPAGAEALGKIVSASVRSHL